MGGIFEAAECRFVPRSGLSQFDAAKERLGWPRKDQGRAAAIQGVAGLHSLIRDHEHGGCDGEGKRSKELLFPRRWFHEGEQVHATRGVFGCESLQIIVCLSYPTVRIIAMFPVMPPERAIALGATATARVWQRSGKLKYLCESSDQLALLHMPRIRSRMSMVGDATSVLAGLALAVGQTTRLKCSQMLAGIKRVRPA